MAAPGMLAAQWQAAGMADVRPLRSRELIKACATTQPPFTRSRAREQHGALHVSMYMLSC